MRRTETIEMKKKKEEMGSLSRRIHLQQAIAVHPPPRVEVTIDSAFESIIAKFAMALL